MELILHATAVACAMILLRYLIGVHLAVRAVGHDRKRMEKERGREGDDDI